MTETPDCLGLPSAVTKHSNKQQRKSEAVHLAHSFRLHPAMAGKSQLGVGVGGHSMREPIATHSEAENDKKKIHVLTLPTSTQFWIPGLEKQCHPQRAGRPVPADLIKGTREARVLPSSWF